MSRPLLAVLTGDIVRSSRLETPDLDAAMAALAEGAAAMAAWPGAGPPRFERFRGDGWQCLAPAPHLALRAALFLRAHLARLQVETRIAVGIGAGDLPAGTGLAAASGAAFEASGRGLDTMPAAAQLAIDWEEAPPDAALTSAVFALTDALSRRWTQAQAEALIVTLAPGSASQHAIGAQAGVSQQAIAKRLRGAGDWALQRALAALEGAP
jgi:hypothetical protein